MQCDVAQSWKICGKLEVSVKSVCSGFLYDPTLYPSIDNITSLLFRAEALKEVGGYSEDKRCILCEDYDLLLRLYAMGFKGMGLQEKLVDCSVPLDGVGTRNMSHCFNEMVTRYRRFKALGQLP